MSTIQIRSAAFGGIALRLHKEGCEFTLGTVEREGVAGATPEQSTFKETTTIPSVKLKIQGDDPTDWHTRMNGNSGNLLVTLSDGRRASFLNVYSLKAPSLGSDTYELEINTAGVVWQ